MNPLFPLFAAVLLASIHVFSGYLRFLDTFPRHRLLSGGAGITVAFVILQLLPAISAADRAIARAAARGVLAGIDGHGYAIVLVSVLIYFAVGQWARPSADRPGSNGRPPLRVFWVHIGTFILMNLLIGYILVARHHQLSTLALFAGVMLLKFLITDRALHRIHKEEYDRVGRWLLIVALLVGWAVGEFGSIPAIGPAAIQAFIAGGVLLNVFSEELPKERQSRLGTFVVAALLFGSVLLLLRASM